MIANIGSNSNFMLTGLLWGGGEKEGGREGGREDSFLLVLFICYNEHSNTELLENREFKSSYTYIICF